MVGKIGQHEDHVDPGTAHRAEDQCRVADATGGAGAWLLRGRGRARAQHIPEGVDPPPQSSFAPGAEARRLQRRALPSGQHS